VEKLITLTCCKEPVRNNPINDTLEPQRAKERSDKADPSWENPKILTPEPKRPNARREHVEPNTT
jgi:hypothetical protein